MKIMALTEAQINRIREVAKAYGATRVILFGSSLDPARKARDLDLAFDGVSGWKLYELGAKLEELLQISLDIVPLTPSTRFTRLVEAKGQDIL
ncbi:MAG: nucleotidyltransferase family protein [bacterium]